MNLSDDQVRSVSTWGPTTWDVLFTLAIHHDRAERKHVWSCFLVLGEVLPCSRCRKSYIKFLEKYPPDVKRCVEREPDYAARWLWSVKDMVNQKLGKSYTSYPSAHARYTAFSSLVSDGLVRDMLRIFLRAEEVHADALCGFCRDLGRASAGLLSPSMCSSLMSVRALDDATRLFS